MRATSKFLALALAAMLQPAIAAPKPIELNFEDITSKVDLDGLVDLQTVQYAGVAFKGAAWGVTPAGVCGGEADIVMRDGGCGAFWLSADPHFSSPGGTQAARIVLDGGFINGSSLYYSAARGSVITVSLYAGEDSTTDPIRTYGLTGGCQTGANFCTWNQLTLDFNGVAKSLVISGADNSVLLDDLSFLPSDVTQPAPLPEPGSIGLALAALGALGWARKRAAR